MPFELLKSETLMKGRAFAIRRDLMRTPDGRETKFDIIEHGGSAVIIPLDAEGNLLFVRQYRHAAGQDLLELPAGTLDEGEPPEVCAAREIRASKSALESLLGTRIDYFSFPFGDHSEKDVSLCREAGYRQVLTSVFEPAFAPADAYVKGRTCVNPSDWRIEFKLKLLGCYAWMPLASALKKGIRRAFSSS